MFLRLSLAGSFIPLLSADIRNEGRPYCIFSGFDCGTMRRVSGTTWFLQNRFPSLFARTVQGGRPAAQHPAALMMALISPANLTPSVN